MIWFIDAEYALPAEADMGLVSVAVCNADKSIIHSWWMRDEEEAESCREWFLDRRGDTLVAFAVEIAEGRVLQSMFRDSIYFETVLAIDWKWIDLMLCWRWLRNQDDKYNYGKIIAGTKFFPSIKTSVPPPRGSRAGKKATRDERNEAKRIALEWAEAQGAESAASANGTLLDALVFFGCINETELREESQIKNSVRDAIIASKGASLDHIREEILRYNEQDILRLPSLWNAMQAEMDLVLASPHIILDPVYCKHIGDSGFSVVPSVPWTGGSLDIAQSLGMWAARCAVYASRGLPFHEDRWTKALKAAPLLIDEAKASFNESYWKRFRVEKLGLSEESIAKHPTPDTDDIYAIADVWKRRVGNTEFPYSVTKYTEDQSSFVAWAKEREEEMGIVWKKTDSGAYASDREYLTSLAADSDLCPIKAYLRCTKEVDALVGLTRPDKGLPRTVGSDFIHRFAVDPYATQTSRNGQGASRFVMSGPHWMRALCDPPEGHCIVALDFGSQEIFIAAALSGDANYMLGYVTGDPYWTYAVLAGAIPASIGTPTEEQRSQEPWAAYNSIRTNFKSTFLGIGFGMQAKSLARHVARDRGTDVSVEEAQGLINDYNSAYPNYAQYRTNLRDVYSSGGCGMMLSDGWRMGSDCPVPNSYLNLPVQGHGAAILRKACELLDNERIRVVATMHDEVVFQCAEEDLEKTCKRAAELMIQASDIVLGVKGMRVGNPEVIRHGQLWMHSKKAKVAWSRIGKHIE
jgi:hypothetical protein